MLRCAALVICGVLATMPAAAQAPAARFAAIARQVLTEGEVLPLDPAIARLMGLPDGEQDLLVHQTADFDPAATRFLIVRQRRGTSHLDILMMHADAANGDIIYCATSEAGEVGKSVRIAVGVARLLSDDASVRAFQDEESFWLWRKRPLSDAAALVEPWHGQWTAPDGSVFNAVLQLKTLPGSRVEGRITWTLVIALDPSEQAKVGVPATELVRGAYDPKSRALNIDGYDKEDPKDVIALDRYRLLLAVDGSALGGITWNHGAWSGVLALRKVQ